MLFIIIAVLLGLAPATIAHYKGRSFLAWWVYGSLIWIIAFPHSLIMSSGVRGGMKKCPSCAELVKAEALKCKHCGESLSVAKSPVHSLECPKCHKTYDSSWKTCLACSTSLIARS